MEDFTDNLIKQIGLPGNPNNRANPQTVHLKLPGTSVPLLTLRQSTGNYQALCLFCFILTILEIMPLQTSPHAEY